MPLLNLVSRYRETQRFRQVVNTFLAYGLETYILPKTPYYKLKAFMKRQKSPPEPPQARFRKALERLGPTFIKFGQILSTRADLLPEEWIRELMKLRDEVPPHPWQEIEKLLATEFGSNWKEIFTHIDREPIGSASIAQVYRGKLYDGEEVAIKVRRPGIEETVNLDIAVLSRIANMLHRHFEELRIYNLPQLVEEFGFTIRREMDFRIEAANMERLSPLLERHHIKVPVVFWNYTTQKVLVTEYIQGVKLENWRDTEEKQCKVAQRLSLAFIDQVIKEGIFHADPHPANIVISEEGIHLLDFGMVGFLDQEMREFVTKVFFHTVRRDYDGIVEEYKRMGMVERMDERRFKLELMGLVDPYLSQSLERINIGEIIQKIIEISIKYGVRFPSEFLMLGRSMFIMDGLVKNLCPRASVIEIVAPYAERYVVSKKGPESVIREIRKLQKEAQQLKENIVLFTKLATEAAVKIKEEGVKVKVLQDEIRDRELRKLGDRLVVTTVSIGFFLASLFSWGFKIGWKGDLPLLPVVFLLGALAFLALSFMI